MDYKLIDFLKTLDKGFHFLVYDNKNVVYSSAIKNSQSELSLYKERFVGMVSLTNIEKNPAFVIHLSQTK